MQSRRRRYREVSSRTRRRGRTEFGEAAWTGVSEGDQNSAWWSDLWRKESECVFREGTIVSSVYFYFIKRDEKVYLRKWNLFDIVFSILRKYFDCVIMILF